MTIWKFTLKVVDEQHISVPKGAKSLTIQIQNDALCLWILCDEKAPKVDRKLRIYGTGHPVDDAYGRYIGTFQLQEGALVFHVFEIE